MDDGLFFINLISIGVLSFWLLDVLTKNEPNLYFFTKIENKINSIFITKIKEQFKSLDPNKDVVLRFEHYRLIFSTIESLSELEFQLPNRTNYSSKRIRKRLRFLLDVLMVEDCWTRTAQEMKLDKEKLYEIYWGPGLDLTEREKRMALNLFAKLVIKELTVTEDEINFFFRSLTRERVFGVFR